MKNFFLISVFALIFGCSNHEQLPDFYSIVAVDNDGEIHAIKAGDFSLKSFGDDVIKNVKAFDKKGKMHNVKLIDNNYHPGDVVVMLDGDDVKLEVEIDGVKFNVVSTEHHGLARDVKAVNGDLILDVKAVRGDEICSVKAVDFPVISATMEPWVEGYVYHEGDPKNGEPFEAHVKAICGG